MLLAQYNFISFPWWFVLGFFAFWIALYGLAIWGYINLIRQRRPLAKIGLLIAIAPHLLLFIQFAIDADLNPSGPPFRNLIAGIIAQSFWSVPMIICSALRLRKPA